MYPIWWFEKCIGNCRIYPHMGQFRQILVETYSFNQNWETVYNYGHDFSYNLDLFYLIFNIQARAEGIKLLGIGVGPDVDWNELHAIVEPPYRDNAFYSENFPDIWKLTDVIVNRICVFSGKLMIIINVLPPGRWGGTFKSVISEHTFYRLNSWALLEKLLSGECHRPPLLQVITWCCQATIQYLGQCWTKSTPPYGVTRPPCVNCCLYST